MKKNIIRIMTLTLVFALVCACTASASAGFWKDYGKKWEIAGEGIGSFWEKWGEAVGDRAEIDSEDLETAIKDAVDKAGDAEENVDMGGFFSDIGGAVKDYLGGMSKWFK